MKVLLAAINAKYIHSNLGTSKIMSTDGSTRITGGVARMAAAQAKVRRRVWQNPDLGRW